MRRERPAPAADKSVHNPRRDSEVLTIASNVLAVQQRAIPNGDRTIAALSARRTIGFAQRQALAVPDPAPLRCKALRRRGPVGLGVVALDETGSASELCESRRYLGLAGGVQRSDSPGARPLLSRECGHPCSRS